MVGLCSVGMAAGASGSREAGWESALPHTEKTPEFSTPKLNFSVGLVCRDELGSSEVGWLAKQQL